MNRLLLMMRHGETDYNAGRRMQGQLDTMLSDTGRGQAREAARRLAGAGIGLILSSDLSRARDTAAIIGAELGLPVREDARLRETHLGRWQGMRVAEVDELHPGARAIWRHDATWAPPGGESRVEVARRARGAIDDLMREHDGWDEAPVLVVAHGGAIAALTCALLELGVEQYPLLSGLGNTRCCRLLARRRFRMPGGEADAADGAADDDGVRWYLDAWNSAGPWG